jgi:hypothetical protein
MIARMLSLSVLTQRMRGCRWRSDSAPGSGRQVVSNFSQRHHQLCSKLWYFMKRIAMRLTRLAAYLDLFSNYKG